MYEEVLLAVHIEQLVIVAGLRLLYRTTEIQVVIAELTMHR